MGPRIYSVDEASQEIPALERDLAELDAVRERLRRLKSKLDVLEMIWGEEIRTESNPDHREFDHYVREIDKAKQEFDALARRFGDKEIMLKSVEQGLVDFYGVVDSRLVFLCWKRGERAVEYYHGLEEGFAGRKLIVTEPERR